MTIQQLCHDALQIYLNYYLSHVKYSPDEQMDINN